jgi:hypothetical protein
MGNIPIASLLVRFLFFVSCVVIVALPFTLYARDSYARDNANVARDTQLLLSLNGFYTGPIDGLCNAQTKQAIEKYQSTLVKTPLTKPLGISCSVQLLETLKNDLSSVLTTDTSATRSGTTHAKNGINDTAPINSLAAEIDDVKATIKNTNTALKGISDGISTHFITLFNNLATIGITSGLAALSVSVALLGFAGVS